MTLNDCLAAGANGVMIPIETYHALPGLSASSLKLLGESNRHYDHRHLFDHEADCLTFGNLVHTATLEPDELENRYIREPMKFDKRTKNGKIQSQEFYENNKHLILVEWDTWIDAQRMARNIRAIYPGILNAGIKERSLFARYDPEIIIKCRLDIELPTGDDFDLKTITPKHGMGDHELLRHSLQFNYHVSAGFRNIVRRTLGITTGDSYLIFVSTSPGHMVKVRQLDTDLVKRGEGICRDLLESRSEYLQYGFDTDPGVLIEWQK